MFFEIKRFVRSIYLPITLAISIGLFALGYVMQIPGYPDGVDLAGTMLGTYVILTQMGIFILPALCAAYFCTDFNEHAILFYRELGYSSASYYLVKVITLTLFFSIGTLVGSFAACMAYGDLSPLPVMYVHYEAVILTYFAFYGTLACLLASFIKAYFASFAYSLIALYVALSVPALRFLQFFEQNGFVYKNLETNIANLSTFPEMELPHLSLCVVYAVAVLAINTLVIFILRKRWLRNGIR